MDGPGHRVYVSSAFGTSSEVLLNIVGRGWSEEPPDSLGNDDYQPASEKVRAPKARLW